MGTRFEPKAIEPWPKPVLLRDGLGDWVRPAPPSLDRDVIGEQLGVYNSNGFDFY